MAYLSSKNVLWKFKSRIKKILHGNSPSNTFAESDQKAQVSNIGYANYSEYVESERHTDHAAYGHWQENYGRMMDHAFNLKGKIALDIGCASGAMLQSFYECGATVYGCDINSSAIASSPFKKIKDHIIAADFCDVTQFNNMSFDLIHSSQVFEHFPSKEYSENVVKRISEIAGETFVYISLVTGEHLTQTQLLEMRSKGEDIDITHVNIWPNEYWIDLFIKYGFSDISSHITPIINCYICKNGFSYFSEYHWDQFVFQKHPVGIEEYAAKFLASLLDRQRDYANKKIYNSVASMNDTPDYIKKVINSFI